MYVLTYLTTPPALKIILAPSHFFQSKPCCPTRASGDQQPWATSSCLHHSYLALCSHLPAFVPPLISANTAASQLLLDITQVVSSLVIAAPRGIHLTLKKSQSSCNGPRSLHHVPHSTDLPHPTPQGPSHITADSTLGPWHTLAPLCFLLFSSI